MSGWSEFHERHGKGNYTPVFNSFLDAQIADVELELPMRVLAWVQRNSWGRHSDACVTAEGIRAGQTDCARELGILDGKGAPDRRKINAVFQHLAQRGVLRLDGWEIVLIDPAMLNKIPQMSERDARLGEDVAKMSIADYLERVVKVSRPSVYEEYQTVERRYKELRVEFLSELKVLSKQSERGATSEEECREGLGHEIAEGSDNAAKRGPTIPPASLYENGERFYNGASSSFSTIREALTAHGQTDDDVIKQLWESCRKNAKDCRPEEIAHFIQVKAALITKKTRNPVGFLLHSVPKCISPQAIDEYRRSSEQLNAAVAVADPGAWISNEREFTRAELEAWLAEETSESARAAIRARLVGLEEES